MPIFGITASSNMTTKLSDFYQIATTTLANSTTSFVEFTSIPQDYTHLQIRAITRTTNAVTAEDVNTQFNGDTTVNYSSHQLYGDGASATSGFYLGNIMTLLYTTGGSATANTFGSAILDILDYTNTNKYKTTRSLSGFDVNGTTGHILLRSGNWRSTSAITSIKLSANGGNLAQYSSFALYGIKG